MASFKNILGNPIYAFRHNLRELKTYANKDIDPEMRDKNYILSSHGSDSVSCKEYHSQLLNEIYVRSGKTCTASQCVITAPVDLDPAKYKEFFESAYAFMNHTLFGGSDERCLLAVVHCDEAGQQHMHYMFTFPEIDNHKYIDFSEKISRGIAFTEDRFGMKISVDTRRSIEKILKRYESSHDTHRELEAIRDISKLLDMKRDDARWIFTRCRRLDSERFSKRLMPTNKLLTKKFFNDFHPEFQDWMDAHGFDCTVFKGGSGFNLTVEQLKSLTKDRGYVLMDKNDAEFLRNRVRELEEKLSQEHVKNEWGQPDWGKEKKWERKY